LDQPGSTDCGHTTVPDSSVKLSRLVLVWVERDEEGGSSWSIAAVQAMAFRESCGLTRDGFKELRFTTFNHPLKARRAEPQVFALRLVPHH
jgi:hypothetical protein